MLDELDFEILALLYKQKEPLASEQIGTWINRSSRTVRNRIKVVNENVRRYGARIDMLPGVGVQLKLTIS
ncbi:HTH domain-containing protein [uncultured Vagococcus sp.]|uniref:HTH domain-containing protein n=1 Tax=uncultured Vagococcus sp. TaxID=189676 RepID=UPI0028D79A3F|nr:HTH domain-containing protein [uncultured Vagococcus sp.]